MSDTLHRGGASALPIARAFLGIGGRLMLMPTGKLDTQIDAFRIFGEQDPALARQRFVIGRRFTRRLRDPRFARLVGALVAIEGKRAANGWLVMEARP